MHATAVSRPRPDAVHAQHNPVPVEVLSRPRPRFEPSARPQVWDVSVVGEPSDFIGQDLGSTLPAVGDFVEVAFFRRGEFDCVAQETVAYQAIEFDTRGYPILHSVELESFRWWIGEAA